MNRGIKTSPPNGNGFHITSYLTTYCLTAVPASISPLPLVHRYLRHRTWFDVARCHATAHNSRLCASRDEGCLISRTDQTSVMRNSHTAAQNSMLCVSRDDGYLISQTAQASAGRNSHATAQISRSRGREFPLPRMSEKHRSRRRLKPERLLCARAVPQIPHGSRRHAIGAHAQIRADRGASKAPTGRTAGTAARS